MNAGTLLDGTTRLRKGGEQVFHFQFLSTFATHTVVPARSAIKVGDGVPLAAASLVGCAIMTGYGAAVNRGGVRPGSDVLVFGAGGVGLSAVMGARIAGARQIIVVDPAGPKRAEARLFGATHTLDVSGDVAEQVLELTDGFGVDVAIDAVGQDGIVGQAFDATAQGGTIVCVGIPKPDARPSVPGPRLVREEKIITGSLYGSCRPHLDMPALIDLFRTGRLPLDKMITKTYRLDEINAAFDDVAGGVLNRGVIVLDEELA